MSLREQGLNATSPLPASILRMGAVLLLALIWLVPFCMPGHFTPLLTYWQEWTAEVLLLAAFLLMVIRTDALSIPKFVLSPLLLMAVIGAQYLIGRFAFVDQLIVPAIYLIVAIMAAITASTLSVQGLLRKTADCVAMAGLLGGLFCVGIQLLQWIGMEATYSPYVSIRKEGQSLFANLNQANHLAAYLALGLGGLYYFRLKEQVGGNIFWACLLMIVLGLALSGQRCALIFSITPFAVSLLGWKQLGQHRMRFVLESFSALIVFICIVLLLQPLMLGMGKLYTISSVPLYANRWLFWQHSLQMFWQHPFLGVGFSQFWSVYVQQTGTFGGVDTAGHPHNLFAALLAETGAVGFLAAIVPLIFWLRRVQLVPENPVQWLGWVQLIVIGSYSMIEFPLWYSYWLIIAAFWLGAMDQGVWILKLKRPRLLAYAIFLAGSIILINVTFSYLKLRDLMLPPMFAAEDQQEFVEYRASAMAGLSNDWIYGSYASVWISSHMIKLDEQDLAQKLSFNTRALLARPNFANLNRQIVLLVLSGEPDKAVYWALVAKKLYPETFKKLPADWHRFSKRWPLQFTEEIISRLSLVE